jgi:curved DNA-binding protein CbpA
MTSSLNQESQKKTPKQFERNLGKDTTRLDGLGNTTPHFNQENNLQRSQTGRPLHTKYKKHSDLKLKKQTRERQEQNWKQKRQNKYREFQHSQRQQQQQQRRKAVTTPTVIVIDDDDEEEEVKEVLPPQSEQSSHKEQVQVQKEQEVPVKVKEPKMVVVDHLESDDYFEVLGLTRQANENEIKKAYRKLAVQWHPDKNRSHPKAEEYFKKIAEAYEVLSDVEKRKMYEKYGKKGLEGKHEGAYHDHFGFGGHAGFSSRHARDIFEAFFGGKDPFEDFFHSSSNRRGRNGRQGEEDDDNDFFGGFGGMGMGMGFGGMGGMGGMRGMMDSFFGGEAMGAGMGGFSSFSSSSSSIGGGMSGFSSSVSSSTYTDRNGHVVTKKTTTTTDETGQTKTVVEEFKNGTLINSSTSTTASRLAGAGRMQLEGGSGRNGSQKASSSSSRFLK